MSHIFKILLKVIFKRNKHKIESVISETKSGFMRGKCTWEGIYNIRTIIERHIECGKNIYNYICFIEYEKAFDRVKHAKTGCHHSFTSREEYDKAVCYHPVCLICSQKHLWSN